MFLALREMRRAFVRFTLLALAIALLAFLVVVQQALQDALITSFVGGIRNQSAPVLVYSIDAQRTLQGGIVPPELEQAVLETEGIGEATGLYQSTFTVQVDHADASDAAIVGTEDPRLGTPASLSAGRRPDGPGEAVGSASDFSVGDEVIVVPSAGGRSTTITVVGVADDVQLSVTPTLYTDQDTYRSAVRSTNPDASAVPPNALAARPAAGVTPEQLVERINASSPDADALTRSDAAAEAPGVAQVQQSFRVIFLLYGLVVPLVTGLFFLIVTLQKARSLVLLRAVGARAGVLVRALLIQVSVVVVSGLAVGVALYAPLSGRRIGALSLRFDGQVIVLWAALFLGLALLSAMVSVRRVLRIDPIEATTGAGVR